MTLFLSVVLAVLFFVAAAGLLCLAALGAAVLVRVSQMVMQRRKARTPPPPPLPKRDIAAEVMHGIDELRTQRENLKAERETRPDFDSNDGA